MDETQLFNENERRLFPLLTRGNTSHVPVVLALDEAQQTRGVVSAGLGLLGFDQLSDAALESVHRSTYSILRLAFFVIQRATDLFGPDFPDFTGTTQPVIRDSHPLAQLPRLARAGQEGVGAESLVRFKARKNDEVEQASTAFDEARLLVLVVCEKETIQAFEEFGALINTVAAKVTPGKDWDIYRKSAEGLFKKRMAVRGKNWESPS